MRTSFLVPVFAALCCTAYAVDATVPLTVPSADKKASITLQLGEKWKTSASKDGSTTIDIPMSGVHIEVWALSQASVEEAEKQAAELIKGYVTKFKVTETKPITVAGAPGKQVTGTGEEADDGDPSNADVYFFSVEGKVFMLCAHGEGDGSVKNRPLIATLLASVKKEGH
ncbi:hypothetical protein [Luteolibacter soli]|uniref:Lipoprotein n=1 Tax=Luteolibacter soli TaxID=3135280 RepID=A0ABU9B199_9BACT